MPKNWSQEILKSPQQGGLVVGEAGEIDGSKWETKMRGVGVV